MNTQRFSAERFAEENNCKTFPLATLFSYQDTTNYPERLLDHGFIADCACLWDERLEGHELAIVARTYCSDDEIDNLPAGLRCIKLDDSVLGDDPGTAVAVVITGHTPAAEAVLSACVLLPAITLAFMIPKVMVDDGYSVALICGVTWNRPVARLVKT